MKTLIDKFRLLYSFDIFISCKLKVIASNRKIKQVIIKKN